jgi:uroporphyrinogen-III decarboxylase
MNNPAMTSLERIETALAVKQADRVPVAPMIAIHAATIANVPVSDFLFNFEVAQQAARKVFDLYNGLDIITFIPGVGLMYNSPFISTHSRLYFNWEFAPDRPPQLQEVPLMGPEGYDKILDEGVIPWLKRPQDFDPQQMLAMTSKMKKEMRYWLRERQVHTFISATSVSPFDLLSQFRGLRNFVMDLRRQPEKVAETAEFLATGLAALAEFMYSEIKGVKRVFIGCVRGSASFISPAMSAELFFPSLKTMVEYLLRDGFQINFHCDTDWTPMLDLFNEFLPAKKGFLTLQLENTDMQKAKEVCGGNYCLMGNVSSTLQKMGNPQQIEDACIKLIKTAGEGGGFILSSGCEVPIDAPFANVKAIVDSAHKHGIYRT